MHTVHRVLAVLAFLLGTTAVANAATAGAAQQENFAGRKAHALDRARIAALTTFVERSARALGVPGVSIGILEHGRTVFAGGFGVRALGKPQRVDADTLYLIASNTKPLTTLMLAKLVEEGKLDWETPVADLLPQARLANAEATARLRLKHMVCACAGLPYRNLDWEFAPPDAPVSIALEILARMTPMHALGTKYTYSNPIAASAGLLGGHVAYPDLALGAAYDKAMATRVFAPLGMRRTTFDFNRATRGNHATSHGLTPTGALLAVPPARDRQMRAVRATGGAWSNVNDLLAYVRMELAGGLLANGRRYLPEAALKARWERQVDTGPHSWYGLGLDTDLSSGTPVMHHGGRFYWQRSDLVWLPEHGVGLVILMNASTGNVLMEAFPRKLLEVLFDGESRAEQMVAAAVASEAGRSARERRTLHIPADPDHAAQLAPCYRSEWLGEIVVRRRGADVYFDFGSWEAPVASRRSAGTVEFIVLTASPPPPFVAGSSGGRRTLTIRDAVHVYPYVEAAEASTDAGRGPCIPSGARRVPPVAHSAGSAPVRCGVF